MMLLAFIDDFSKVFSICFSFAFERLFYAFRPHEPSAFALPRLLQHTNKNMSKQFCTKIVREKFPKSRKGLLFTL